MGGALAEEALEVVLRNLDFSLNTLILRVVQQV